MRPLANSQAAVGIAHTDEERRILRVNRKLEELLGRPARELVGRSMGDLSHPEDAQATADARGALYRNEVPAAMVDTRYLRADGSIIWMRVTISLARNTAGQVQQEISVLEDITERKRAEERLQASEARFRSLSNLLSDWFWETDAEHRFVATPEPVTQSTSLKGPSYIGKRCWEVEGLAPASGDWTVHQRMLERREAYRDLELVQVRQDGSPCYLQISGEPIFDAAGRFHGYRGTAKDITELKRGERLLRLEHDVSRGLSEADDAATALTSTLQAIAEVEGWEGGRYYEVDEKASVLNLAATWHRPGSPIARYLADTANLTFRPGAGLVGRVWKSGEPLWAADVRADKRVHNHSFAAASSVLSAFVFPAVARGRVIGAFIAFGSQVRQPDSRLLMAVRAIGSQLGQFLQRRKAEQRLAHLAQFDAVTGLANRALFRDRLDQALAQAGRNHWRVGLLVLNIDRFKRVNDTLGRDAGDALLREAGARLHRCLRSGDTVARLESDAFAIVLPDLESPDAARVVARKLLDALGAPFSRDGRELFLTAAVGISLHPGDGTEAETLERNATAAMRRAKDSGRDGIEFYSAEMNAESLQRLELEKDLRSALPRGEFELHFQPKIATASGQVTGAEALLRWRNAGGALVSPAHFIPLLEDTGLIVEVGEWVIRQACRQAAEWEHRGMPAPRIAVNVSPRQFRSGTLVESVRGALAASGCAPECLEIEVTESMLMQDLKATIETLDSLRALGVHVAVDDFGTGYSSLSYLKKLPVDVIKIDRSFIREVASDADDTAIVTAIIRLAHTLGYRVVAEGVETEAQHNLLRLLGCDEVQGFLFSPALPAKRYAEWLAARENTPCKEAEA